MKDGIKSIKRLLKTPYFYIIVVCVIAIIVGVIWLGFSKDNDTEDPVGGLEIVEEGEDVEDEDVIDFSEFEDDDKDSDKNQADDNKDDNNDKDDNKEDNNDKDDDKDNNNDKEDDNKEPDKKDGNWGKFF